MIQTLGYVPKPAMSNPRRAACDPVEGCVQPNRFSL